MTPESIHDIVRNAIFLTMKLGGPMLIAGLIMGVIVSVAQAATQINEQTLSFIPKIVVIVGTLVLLAPWMFSTFRVFAVGLIGSIPELIR